MSTATLGQLAWLKSSYSGAEGGEYLELAATSRTVHIRDSKTPAHPQLTFPHPEWATFVQYVTER